MSNTLNLGSVSEFIYAARDRVARELVGFIPSVMINSGSERVSLGGTVQSLRSVKPTLNTSHTPAMTIPAADDYVPETDEMAIAQVANVKIPWTGESALRLRNTGQGREAMTQTFAQTIRTMVNAIESHCGIVAKNGSSRATGGAGTNPFATNHNPINDLRKILTDNGCPFDGQNSLIINSTAGVALRNLTQLTKANEAGSTNPIRQGTLLDISGFMLKETAGVAAHTKGTANTAYDTNLGATLNAGATAIAVDTGSGTIVPGDILAFTGDTNRYVVASALADGAVTIARPGLIGTLADGVDVALTANYTGNVGFHQSAIELAMRPPAMPDGGDAASDRMTIVDDVSGLVFEVALYKGYGMVMYDFTCYYQAKVWKPEFVATLVG